MIDCSNRVSLPDVIDEAHLPARGKKRKRDAVPTSSPWPQKFWIYTRDASLVQFHGLIEFAGCEPVDLTNLREGVEELMDQLRLRSDALCWHVANYSFLDSTVDIPFTASARWNSVASLDMLQDEAISFPILFAPATYLNLQNKIDV